MAQYVERLARQMDKALRFEIHGGDLPLDPVQFKPVIQSLIHAVRNSRDHGIEWSTERQGKPGIATIGITFRQLDKNAVEIIVEDDGRGINLSHLVASVRQKDLLPTDRIDSVSL